MAAQPVAAASAPVAAPAPSAFGWLRNPFAAKGAEPVAPPAAAPAVPSPAPAPQAATKRFHVEARPVSASNRRPVQRVDAVLPASTLLLAALAVIGLLAAGRAARPSWTPTLLPVQRGPPSLR